MGILKTLKYSNLGLASEIQKASKSEQAGSSSCFSGMPSRYLRTVKQRKESIIHTFTGPNLDKPEQTKPATNSARA